MTVIDAKLARKLGLETGPAVDAISTSGPMTVAQSTADIRAGSIAIDDLPVLIADLPRFPTHGRIDGLLGMNFLAGRSFLVDLQRRCLDVDADSIPGTEMPATVVADRIAVQLHGVSFILDSGASFPVLMSERARGLAVRDGDLEMTTAGGRTRTTTATARVFGNRRAIFAPPTGHPREDGLLPLALFRAVWVSADRARVVLR